MWDFSSPSLDALAQVMLAHCPIGQPVLDGDAGEDFYDGLVWYFGETLRRGKPSRWHFSPTNGDPQPAICGEARPTAAAMVATRAAHDKRLAVYLAQELDHAAGCPRGTPAQPSPTAQPDWLRNTHERWIRGPIEERTDKSLRRRESVKTRFRRTLDDEQFLTRWLAERRAGFDTWSDGVGVVDVDWDFGPDSLDALETLVWHLGGPEALLEDPTHQAFTDGAIWYLGESELRRIPPQRAYWTYFRGWTDPYLALSDAQDREPIRALALVYADMTAGHTDTLRAWHDRCLGTLSSAPSADR